MREAAAMEYRHATAEHHRQFLTGRLAALEQEHYGYELLIEGAPDDDPQRPGWIAARDATERNIRSLRAGLDRLPTPDDEPTPAPPAKTTAGRTSRARLPRK